MPLYEFECPWCGVREDHYRTVGERNDAPRHHNRAMKRIITAPAIHVGMDINYASPIDGRPVTSKQARIEDLARSGCVEYEPTMRAHQARREQARDAALEKSVDETVETAIHAMPARKRERLVAELEGGMSAEPVLVTPQQQSFREA